MDQDVQIVVRPKLAQLRREADLRVMAARRGGLGPPRTA